MNVRFKVIILSVIFCMIPVLNQISAQAVSSPGILGVNHFENATDFLGREVVFSGNMAKVVFISSSENRNSLQMDQVSTWLRRTELTFKNTAIRLDLASVAMNTTTWNGVKYDYVEANVDVNAMLGVQNYTTTLMLEDPKGIWKLSSSSVVNVKLRMLNLYEIAIIDEPVQNSGSGNLSVIISGPERATLDFVRLDGNDVLVQDGLKRTNLRLTAINGSLDIDDVFAGYYSIAASAPGFCPDSVVGIRLKSGTKLTVTLTLKKDDYIAHSVQATPLPQQIPVPPASSATKDSEVNTKSDSPKANENVAINASSTKKQEVQKAVPLPPKPKIKVVRTEPYSRISGLSIKADRNTGSWFITDINQKKESGLGYGFGFQLGTRDRFAIGARFDRTIIERQNDIPEYLLSHLEIGFTTYLLSKMSILRPFAGIHVTGLSINQSATVKQNITGRGYGFTAGALLFLRPRLSLNITYVINESSLTKMTVDGTEISVSNKTAVSKRLLTGFQFAL